MKKIKPLLKDKERTILRFIDEQGGGCTPHQIAKKTGISYITVRKYLKLLVERGILEEENG